MFDEVRHPPHPGGDHRSARGHGLDERDGRALVARGEGHHVEIGVDALQVVSPAQEADTFPEAESPRQRLELPPSLSVAHHDCTGSRPGVAEISR